jgi:putative tryptophan/tyrosine transport system substrate-binding protein
MMRRREFITLLGGAAAAWPLAARAQQPGLPVVGYLYGGVPEAGVNHTAAFRKGLTEAGYVEGRNVTIEYRWGQNDSDRFAELAADLVRRRVSVIVTAGSSPASLAAKAATATIPIVFEIGADPVGIGLVASLNRPGGNVTGIAAMNSELAPKRLGIVHELIRGPAPLGALLNPTSSSSNATVTADLQSAAARIGRRLEVFLASANRDIDTVFEAVVEKRIGALIVGAGPFFTNRRAQLVTLAARYAVPAIYSDRDIAEAGGLMSYASNVTDQYRQTGLYTGRILKGEKPADLPVMQPTRFEFVINLQIARLLRIDIPPTLLAIADEVIE